MKPTNEELNKENKSRWIVSYVDKNNEGVKFPIITTIDVLGKEEIYDINKIVSNELEKNNIIRDREELKIIKQLLEEIAKIKEALNNQSPQQKPEHIAQSHSLDSGKVNLPQRTEDNVEDKTPKPSDGHSLKEGRGLDICESEKEHKKFYDFFGSIDCDICNEKFTPKGEVLK